MDNASAAAVAGVSCKVNLNLSFERTLLDLLASCLKSPVELILVDKLCSRQFGTFHLSISTHESPTHESPTHDSPSHDSSAHDSSAHDSSAHDSSAHESPSHESPYLVSSSEDNNSAPVKQEGNELSGKACAKRCVTFGGGGGSLNEHDFQLPDLSETGHDIISQLLNPQTCRETCQLNSHQTLSGPPSQVQTANLPQHSPPPISERLPEIHTNSHRPPQNPPNAPPVDNDRDRERSSYPWHGSYGSVVCKFCHTRFSTAQSLKRHINNRHAPNPKQYKCVLCTATFKLRYDLKRHYRLRHKLDGSSAQALVANCAETEYSDTPPVHMDLEDPGLGSPVRLDSVIGAEGQHGGGGGGGDPT